MLKQHGSLDMKHITLNDFYTAYDLVKDRCHCSITNIMHDRQSLYEYTKQKNCQLFIYKNSIFLLILCHNEYYDCLYAAENALYLDIGVKHLLLSYKNNFPIKISIIGNDISISKVYNIFISHNFRLIKKLLRMKTEITSQTEASAEKVMDAMRSFSNEYMNCISFAEIGDAEEILEILKENFDLVGDNIPELFSIRQNISKRQVLVLRQDQRIASLLYFTIKNNIFHGLYDVTRKEYRGSAGLFLANSVFRYEYFKSHGIKFKRFLGWRDSGNKKLMKYAETRSPERPDGVVIYNMLWTPDEARNVQPETRL